MHGTYLIEVTHKPGIKDPLAAQITDDLEHLGGRVNCKVATSKLYRLIGQLSADERARVGRDLLADPVVEEVREGRWTPDAAQGGKPSKANRVVVAVWYKQGV